MVRLIRATSLENLKEAEELFREYARWLNIDACTRQIETEIAALPGAYGPPHGAIFLAYDGPSLAGCVAVRRIAADTCELKRLFVRNAHRGQGIARALVQAVIDHACAAQCERILLDTISSRMQEAVSLYKSFGFKDIPAYGPHPGECTNFMALDLSRPRTSSA